MYKKKQTLFVLLTITILCLFVGCKKEDKKEDNIWTDIQCTISGVQMDFTSGYTLQDFMDKTENQYEIFSVYGNTIPAGKYQAYGLTSKDGNYM
jgi:hypothetical protein